MRKQLLHSATATAILAFLLVAVPGRAADTDFEIFAFSETSGNMVPMRCSDDPGEGATYAHLAARLASARGKADGLVLLAGGLLGDDPFSRYLATRGAWATRRLEDLMAMAGIHAAVPGVGEFALPGGHSIPLLRHLAEDAVPYGALNLDCGAADSALCQTLRDRGVRIHTIRGLRVAVLSLIGPATVQFADPRNRDHKAMREPALVASEAATRLRAEGEADLVVALVNLDQEATSPARTMAFARAVKGVDLVVAGLGRNLEARAGLDLVRLDGGRCYVVGVAPGVDALTRIAVHVEIVGGRPTIRELEVSRLPTVDAPPLAEATHLLSQTAAEFCAMSMRPLRSGRLEAPISAWRFLRYAMEVARREVGADLTVFTSDSLWADPDERLEGAITAEDLNRMFPRWELAVLDVKGAALRGFLAAAVHAGDGPSPKGVEVLGASLEGPPPAQKVFINRRLLDDGRWYRLVTTRYLALGGRGALAPLLPGARPVPLDETIFIRELVRSFLDRDRPLRLGGNPPLRPEEDFRDLWDLPRWDLSSAATVAFTQVHIDKAADRSYDDPQLNRAELLGLNGDLLTRAVLSNRIMLWNNLLQLQYGETSTGDGGLQETRDRIVLESAWSWTWLRNRITRGQAWIPVPMLKAKLESEFTRAPAADHHHLEGTATLGPQWLPTDQISLFFGYGLRNELSDPGDPLHQGLEVGYAVNRMPLLRDRFGTPMLELESRFELFWSDLGARHILKGLGSTALHVALLDWLRFFVSVNLFLFKEQDHATAFAVDTSAGLSFLGAFSVQDYW